MSKIAVIVSTGYEDIELITTIDMLKRVGIEYDLISVENKDLVEGSQNAIVKTMHINKFDAYLYGSIFLPGGIAVEQLRVNKKVVEIVKNFFEQGKDIYAICAAPIILRDLGILKNIKHTAYPGHEYKPTFKNSSVVKSKNVITSNGPGSTIKFALKIIENERNKKAVEEIMKSMKIS